MCLCWLLYIPTLLLAQNLDSLYRCLDKEIVKFPQYVARHDQEVADLLSKLTTTVDDEGRFVAGEAEVDEPRLIQPLGRLLQ